MFNGKFNKSQARYLFSANAFIFNCNFYRFYYNLLSHIQYCRHDYNNHLIAKYHESVTSKNPIGMCQQNMCCNIITCSPQFVYRMKSGSTEADDLCSNVLVCGGLLCVKMIVKTRA